MKRSIATTISLPASDAETLDLQVWPVLDQWRHSNSNDLMELARSYYLQGLVDGSRSEVIAALTTLKENECGKTQD